MKKRYLYKIYDSSGAFITTWKDVINDPNFSISINGSFSELTVRLARPLYAFGENHDVRYGNRLKLYVFDKDSGTDGVCIYSGSIANYQPIVDGGKETIEVLFASFWWEMSRYLLEGDGSGIDSPIYGAGYGASIVPTMTANNSPSPYVVSASTEFAADHAAWKAFDGKVSVLDAAANNPWAATVSTGWLKIDLGSGVTKQVQKYVLISRQASMANQAPKNWTFEGSNNGSTWDILDTQTNQENWGDCEPRVFTFENNTPYRYYRINVSANNGSPNLAIYELQIFESVAFSRVGATSVKYLSKDPSNMLKDILDKFTAAGGLLDYGDGTVDLTGTSASYQFNTNTVQEAAKKIIELCPQDWYFYVGADDRVYLKPKKTTVDHKFHIGRNVTYYRQEKRLENIVNYIYFKGKDFFKKYKNDGSVAAYGRYTQKIVDERVTKIATADIMASTILNKMASPEIRITIRVLDSNAGSEIGYDIESIRVGDTCKIYNATAKAENLWDDSIWDADSWDYDVSNTAGTILQIQKVTYFPDYVELEISNRQPDIAKRIEDINKNLVDSQTVTNPVIPQ